MRIGIDIDGTLAPTMERFLPWYNEHHGTRFAHRDLKEYELTASLGISYERMKEIMALFYSTPLFQRLPPYAYAQETVGFLHERGDELFIVTARPHEVEEATHRFVGRHFRDRFSAVHFCNHYSDNGREVRDKAAVFSTLEVDLVIEDHPTYAQRCAKKGILTLIFDQPWNTSVKAKGMYRIHSWREAGGIIDCVRSRRNNH